MPEEMTKRVLTDEVRNALIGDMPFSSTSTIPFTPKQFLKKGDDGNHVLPKEYQAVFDISGMTKPQKASARKLILKVAKGLDDKEQSELKELTRFNTKGWQNLFDIGTKEELAYKEDPDGGCEKELFNRIPEAIIGQLFFEITKISGLLDTTLLGLKS